MQNIYFQRIFYQIMGTTEESESNGGEDEVIYCCVNSYRFSRSKSY